ncbi:MAG: NAD(+)/NADH kinase [bacterium]
MSPTRVAIRYMPHYGGADEQLPPLLAALARHGCEVRQVHVPDSDLAAPLGQLNGALELLTAQDLIIALGGDGTLLSTARLVAGSGIPILGLNLKGLGFLTTGPAAQSDTLLDCWFNGECVREERRMLDVCYIPAGETEVVCHPFAALNDVAVMRGAPSKMVQLELSLDGRFLTSTEADGLIITTPTGSTAYSLAGGGSILWPELDVMGITPIMPHALTIRPIVVPANTRIEIRAVRPARGHPHLNVDGTSVMLDRHRVYVEVTGSKKTTSLVRMPGAAFGDILREKLAWGGRLRGDQAVPPNV